MVSPGLDSPALQIILKACQRPAGSTTFRLCKAFFQTFFLARSDSSNFDP